MRRGKRETKLTAMNAIITAAQFGERIEINSEGGQIESIVSAQSRRSEREWFEGRSRIEFGDRGNAPEHLARSLAICANANSRHSGSLSPSGITATRVGAPCGG